MRNGFPGNRSGPTFFLLSGKTKNPAYTDEFLERNGAAKYSSVIMTPTGYLTTESWKDIVTRHIAGVWHVVIEEAAKLGIDEATARKLYIGQFFDGFGVHTKELMQLLEFALSNMICAVENRDSSEMCQAFDKWVAKAGKKRGRDMIDVLRRSHIDPMIDQWTLVIVGLAMLRDCDASNVWECSFIAVNMHPLHRIPLEDWLDKIRGFTRAAEKFDDEVIDLSAMLPKAWLESPLTKRQTWLKTIKDHNAEYDVELLGNLRKQGMTLQILANIFKIYEAEKKIAAGTSVSTYSSKVKPSTPSPEPTPAAKPTRQPGQMIYHLFKIPKGFDMTPTEKLEHAITVRNRTLGPKAGTTVSPYLDVEISSSNQTLLELKPEDVNMYRVLQESTCKTTMRRKVARRTLTALGSASGLCGILNGPDEVRMLKANLKFAESLEEIRAAEKKIREEAAEVKKQKKTKAKKKKETQAKAREQKRKVVYETALEKLGLAEGFETVYRRHIKDLTGPQLKAVAFFQLGESLTGNVGDMRKDMQTLLAVDPNYDPEADEDGIPEYPTQDELFEEPSSSSSEEAREVIEFEYLYIGDIVEVYWKGEDQWFEGNITDVDAVDRQFEIFYKADSKKLWHDEKYYPVREPL